MECCNECGLGIGMIILFSVLALWDIIWRAIALWKSARNNHLAWFICFLIFSTIGILPIIYILINRKKPAEKEAKA
ncbi:MAG: DUF5652 family protein [Bacteroidales bacterium]|nr:DUF5652 family protein [Bacteroidales bacterium]MDD3989479.1 DUF5652 family protein [Bacteroidales bacterium]MDD4638363.1 DUF5652 family protein [Bacteroidales bacterium]